MLMKINRTRIEHEFTAYVSDYDLSDPKIKLKYDHTFRVADNCERIAKSLDMSAEDVDIAWTLGMFHDIGRFEQVRRYHTFQDGQSVNHAALSADLLFHEKLVNRFLDVKPENVVLKAGDTGRDNDEEQKLLCMMEQAIRLHNVYRLPDSLTGKPRTFAEILRDADRVDILRVNCETPRSEIYNLPEEEFATSSLTDEVYRNLMNREMVNRKYSKSGIDFLVGHIGFVFGLEFAESRAIVKEQGYLDQMLSFTSRNPETEDKLQQIRRLVRAYLHA